MSEDYGTYILSKKALDRFISIHVHKAGGTTLGFILNDIYDDKFFWDKSEDTVNFHGRVRNYDMNAVRKHAVIHGHIHVNKYRNLKRPYITWLRHPVTRLESEYSVIRQKRISKRSSKFHKRVILEEMSFLEYCQTHREVFTRYLGNMFVDDFVFIGITEHYKESLHVLSKIIKKKIPPYFKRNTRKMKRQWFKEGDEGEKKICAELNHRDIQFWAEAKDRLLKQFALCDSDFSEENYEPETKQPGKRYYK